MQNDSGNDTDEPGDEQTASTAEPQDESVLRADEPRTCANCGAKIDVSEWHPLVTRTEGDEYSVYAFCDETCRDEWLAEDDVGAS